MKVVQKVCSVMQIGTTNVYQKAFVLSLYISYKFFEWPSYCIFKKFP